MKPVKRNKKISRDFFSDFDMRTKVVPVKKRYKRSKQKNQFRKEISEF